MLAPMTSDTAAGREPAAAGSTPSPRFERKRDLILDAATLLINQRGLKGMTFVEVAQAVQLNTPSVTYYFRLKEQLAAAVYAQTLDRLEALTAEAVRAADPRTRVHRYLELSFDLRAHIRRGEARPIAALSDMRALDDTVRAPLAKRYGAIFRRVRDEVFGPHGDAAHKALNTARAQVLSESVFWAPVWLARYSVGDYGRCRDRLFDIFDRGLAPPGAAWRPTPLRMEGFGAEGPRDAFLRAATRLISERGYRGASVERIATELKVTKGSFYHHLEAKDDLVLECFERSYGRVSQAQRAADVAGGDQWRRLGSAIAALLDIQFQGDWPLLRTTALATLPSEVRPAAVDRSNRLALRFAGTISDGIAEGSIRPVDASIASQAVMATLNAANELRSWSSAWPRDQAVALYASTLAYGLFDDRALREPLTPPRLRALRPPELAAAAR